MSVPRGIANVLGEHAEQQFHQEMSGVRREDVAASHPVGHSKANQASSSATDLDGSSNSHESRKCCEAAL